MDRPYRIALMCGIAPQTVGIAIFLLWLVTRWEWLVGAGLVTIYAGVFSVLIGAIALAMSTFDFSDARSSPGRRRFALALAAALLVANFPMAAAVSFGALTIMTAYVVTIHNDSGAPLHDVRSLWRLLRRTVHQGNAPSRLHQALPLVQLRRRAHIRGHHERWAPSSSGRRLRHRQSRGRGRNHRRFQRCG